MAQHDLKLALPARVRPVRQVGQQQLDGQHPGQQHPGRQQTTPVRAIGPEGVSGSRRGRRSRCGFWRRQVRCHQVRCRHTWRRRTRRRHTRCSIRCGPNRIYRAIGISYAQLRQPLARQALLQPQVALAVGTVFGRAAQHQHLSRPARQRLPHLVWMQHAHAGQRYHHRHRRAGGARAVQAAALEGMPLAGEHRLHRPTPVGRLADTILPGGWVFQCRLCWHRRLACRDVLCPGRRHSRCGRGHEGQRPR